MSIKEFEVSNKAETSGFVIEKANLQLNQSLESQFATVTNKGRAIQVAVSPIVLRILVRKS